MRCALCDKIMEPHEIKWDKTRKKFLDCPRCRSSVFLTYTEDFMDKRRLTLGEANLELGIDTPRQH
jgi:hypothetical protein